MLPDQERDVCYDLAIQALLTGDAASPVRETALALALDSENGEFLERMYTRMLNIPQLHGLLCRLQPRDPAALVVWMSLHGILSCCRVRPCYAWAQ